MLTVIVIDERPPGHPQNSYDLTREAIGAYLSLKLNAAVAGLTDPQVVGHQIEYSPARNTIRHYFTLESS